MSPQRDRSTRTLTPARITDGDVPDFVSEAAIAWPQCSALPHKAELTLTSFSCRVGPQNIHRDLIHIHNYLIFLGAVPKGRFEVPSNTASYITNGPPSAVHKHQRSTLDSAAWTSSPTLPCFESRLRICTASWHGCTASVGRWNFERPLDGMQVYILQRCLDARDLSMDALQSQAVFARRCRLHPDGTTFVKSEMQPLSDQ